MRPIELVRQLFGSISPTYLNEAIDIGREIDDPARIITTTNLDPRQASKLVQDAAAGSGRIARETGSNARNKDLQYSKYGRGSNTQIKSIRQAEDAFGRRFDIDNPITLYGSSPVLSGMDGSSSFDLVIPQTKQIADFVENRFNPNQPINPLIISDGNQYKGFLPVDRVAAANLNPRRVITGEEQKNKVLNTLKNIVENPYIPTAAKEQLLKVTQNDIFSGIRNIGDNDNLGLDFGNLERFASALRNDKDFTKGLSKGEYDELVWLSKQMSGAKALDNTLNNQFTRLKGDNLLAGMAFDYDPQTGLFLTPQYQKPSINLDGATFQVDQESLAKDIAAANQRRESYKPQPIGEGQFFIDPQQTNLTGKTPFAKQIGRGNVIFSNELIDANAAQGIQMGYVNALETGINELLKQNVKTIKSADGNARTFLKKDTLPELTPDLPAGTLGYTVVPQTVKGAVRNVPRLGLVTKNPVTGQSSIQLARQDRPILFSSGKDAAGFNFVDENDIYYPLGDIQRTTQRIINDDGTEDVVDDLIFPSPIASLVAGRIQYNRPDELESINQVFRDGEDKLKALAKVAMMPIPEAVDGKVQFPVAMKRLARNTDNFLASELPEDAQSQLLAQALNYGSPNFSRLQNLGIQPTPESNVAKALKSNILDEPTAVTVMPISWDIKDQTQIDWDDLYAAQLLDPQGKVADSIVIPYNEAVGNPKLLGSVQKAYKNLTGIDPELKWLDTPDGNVIAYIGNTPNQVRSFPDWSSPDRGREPLVDTRKIENTLLSWLGAKDAEMIGDVPSAAPVNMQNIDQVLYEVTKNPQTRSVYDSAYVKEDRPIEVFKNPNENFGSGLGAYDERSGDLYNVGDPVSSRASRYSLALRTFFDPRTASKVEDVPEVFRSPEFLSRYTNNDGIVTLDTDEVDALERWLSDNVTFKEGQAQSITPYTILEQEARASQAPFVYRESVGTPADDIRNTQITSDGTSVYLQSRKSIQPGLDPNDVVSVRTTYYPPAQKPTVQPSPVNSVMYVENLSGMTRPVNQEFNVVADRTTSIGGLVQPTEGSIRNLYPNSPVSYDASGNVIKVYHPLWDDPNRPANYSTAVNSAAIRNAPENLGNQMLDTRLAGLVDQGAAIRLDPVDITVEMNHSAPLIEHYYNLEQKALARGDKKAADFYRTEREIAQYSASRAPILKAEQLGDLNLDNSSINTINEYLPIEQQIQTSDGYTSINEPAIWRNDSVGWSDNSTLEPSVTYELTDPENVAIRRDGLPALRVNNDYLRQVKKGDLIDDELVRGDGTYIYVPQSVDDAVSEWTDRMAANERVDDSSLVNAILDNRFVVDQNILDSERQFYPPIESIRTPSPLQQENRQLIDSIIAASPQNVARRSESIRQANIDQPVVVNAQGVSQPVVVSQQSQPTQQPMITREAVALRPEQRNSVGGTNVITTQSTPVTQGFDWNNLSQEQKLMLLGLGGLGTYGLYDAVNQPQQSYAVR